ncbi:MAG: hypothetical protein ACMXYL_05125 [Candidatus Woesearchaeota archaeon]
MRVTIIVLLALFLIVMSSANARAEYIDVITIIGSIDRNGTLYDYSLYHGMGESSSSHEDSWENMFKFSTYDSEWNILREINRGFSYYLSFGGVMDMVPFQLNLPSSDVNYIAVLKDDSIVYVINFHEYVCAGLCDGCDALDIKCDPNGIIVDPPLPPPPVIVDDEPDMNIVLVASIFLVFFLAIVFIGVWRGKHGSKND